MPELDLSERWRAEDVPCPLCGAGVGIQCHPQNGSTPHYKRADAAWRKFTGKGLRERGASEPAPQRRSWRGS